MAFVSWGFGSRNLWFRAIQDSQMIDFNPALFLRLGSCLRQLSNVRAGIMSMEWAATFIEARNGIVDLLTDQNHRRIFPKTGERAQVILNRINSIVPDVPAGTIVPNRPVSQAESDDLEIELQAFVTSFHDECSRAYIVAVEKQRAFDLHTLVESIETAFDGDTWVRLSIFSKREIKESGRCLALERYTASGFHMLRAIENETRDCATLVGCAQPTRRDFGDYIKILKENGADGRLVAVLDNVRSLERNPLVHPEDWLKQDEAVNIFCIAQAVFSRLMACLEKMNLLPPIKQ
jgi:hypothetical protein